MPETETNHEPDPKLLPKGGYRPSCSCGWQGTTTKTRDAARKVSQKHAANAKKGRR